MRLERTVRTDKPVEQVFDYLSDFTTTTDWDPGTVSTERTSGDGGVGTTYRNVSKFAGRETEVLYTVLEHVPNQRLVLRGKNKTVTATDTMTFRSLGDAGDAGAGGTEVTYSADFDFGLLTPVIGLVMRPAFKKLGDEAEQGLDEALARL